MKQLGTSIIDVRSFAFVSAKHLVENRLNGKFWSTLKISAKKKT